jgi:DNA modification methylase
MKAYYKNELTTIYNGDCLEVMDYLIEQGVKVDAIITSPPYNIGKEYETKKNINHYLNFIDSTLQKLYKLLKDESSLIINVGKYIDDDTNNIPIDYLIYPILLKNGFKLRQNIIWCFNGGLNSKKKLSGRYESVMWLYKGKELPKFNLDKIRIKKWKRFDKRNNPNGKNPTDIWNINTVVGGSNEKLGHPCQFPLELIRRCVEAFTDETDIVLDCFSGSFTTSYASEQLNRRSIGIELEKKYCDVGVKRLSQLQMRLDI